MRAGQGTLRTLTVAVIGLLCAFGEPAGTALAVDDEPLTRHSAPSEPGPNGEAAP